MIIGYDLLGLGSSYWRVQPLIDLLPHGSAIGCFTDNTFGNAWIKIRKLLSTGKHPIFRGQLHWDPAGANGVSAHKIIPLEKLKKQLPKLEQLALDFPNVKIYASHSCEYKEQSKAAISARVSLIKQLAPHCVPVNTPMNSPVAGDAITEIHAPGKAKAGQIWSTDGQSILDGDAEKEINKSSNATICFLWAPLFNLREAGAFIPPPERKAAPPPWYIRDVIAVAQPKGNAPAPLFHGNIKPIKKPTLWKTCAEDHIGSDPRGCKPLLICGTKANQAEVLDFKGNRIAKLGYYGTFTGGQFRYYSGWGSGSKLSSSELAEKAIQSSGSPFVWFKVGNIIYGPTHAAFRTGYFQW